MAGADLAGVDGVVAEALVGDVAVLGWEQVAPLDTFFYPLHPQVIARGKASGRLRAGMLSWSLGALTGLRRLRGRPRRTWSPDVRTVDRFGPEHDALVVHAGLLPDLPLEDQDPYDLMNMRSILDDGSASRSYEEGTPWSSLWTGPRLVVFVP